MKRWAVLLVCLAGCHDGYAISLSLDVQCPSATTISIEVTASPNGQAYSDSGADAMKFRRVVIVPPPNTSSVHVTARALDLNRRVLATGMLDIPVTGSGLQQQTLPLLCGTCTAGCSDTQLCCVTSCIDPDNDEKNCGGCGLDCARSHAQATSCAVSTCRIDACEAEWLDCDGDLSNGCEHEASNPSTGCGCAAPCSSAHVAPSCAAGACVGSCEPGWADCDLDLRSNGCESNPQTDAKNCGMCGRICPSGRCDAGVCERRVFVSSANYTGNLGGLAGADQVCQLLANTAKLGGTYKAWLSTDTEDAVTHFGTQSAGVLTLADATHTKIADSFDDLLAAQQPMKAIQLTELGTPPIVAGTAGSTCSALSNPVWTNTRATGTRLFGSCAGWTSDAVGTTAYIGDAKVALAWSFYCDTGSCNDTAAIYCFEQ